MENYHPRHLQHCKISTMEKDQHCCHRFCLFCHQANLIGHRVRCLHRHPVHRLHRHPCYLIFQIQACHKHRHCRCKVVIVIMTMMKSIQHLQFCRQHLETHNNIIMTTKQHLQCYRHRFCHRARLKQRHQVRYKHRQHLETHSNIMMTTNQHLQRYRHRFCHRARLKQRHQVRRRHRHWNRH